MKCKLLVDMPAGPSAPDELCEIDGDSRIIKAGTEIEDAGAWRLVHGGFAESADEECAERVAKCNQTQSGALREVHERIMREQREFQDDLEAEEDEDEEE